MDPGAQSPVLHPQRFPRTRGDGPDCSPDVRWWRRVSPHTRGWTPLAPAHRLHREGFPAHAGMDPRWRGTSRRSARFPRTRGDGPRARGPAARTRPVSPHTRGWTRAVVARLRPVAGFPAHAGMDLILGDGPRVGLGFPRTRGDGPLALDPEIGRLRVSPHTRGWTRASERLVDGNKGFPAHAGMDPSPPSCRRARPGFPRTRGDGPAPRPCRSSRVPVSPHTRGWTRHAGRDPGRIFGFPAHAGMDPGRPGA